MVDSSNKTVEEMSGGMREIIKVLKIDSSCVLRRNADVDYLLRIRNISLSYIHPEY